MKLAGLAAAHTLCQRRHHVHSAGLRAGCWRGAALSGGPSVEHRQMPVPPPFSCPLLVQVAGHPSGVRWEPGGLLLRASGSDFKGHFGGRHRGSFCLLCPQCESRKAFSDSRTGLFLGPLGWLQDAALPPALIHAEGIGWGVPSFAAVQHICRCEGETCCSKVFEGLGREGLWLGSGELGAKPEMLVLS